ncbi:hypothetical protein QR680_003247 [Steinernema hermaphroditum]|uniref:Uncharacterized protein n=1 Tax=Steinernema hermaphroditum TaxID=289476 RepID=A0AA39H840_9BILA|nr:hypothetical protein QR680_003247 [Steinernema hermaphroditum]
MKPWREVLFLALSICYVQAQYDFGADNSPPASKYKGVGGAVGAHIGIDNPHASGGYSPTLPPSNINYYPPPDIPRPDFRVWSSAQKSNEVVPNAVQAASTQAYATSGSSGASGAGAGAGVSIGKVPPVKFTIRNLGPNPDFLKAYRGKGASVSAKLEGSSATGGKITEESSQIDLAGSGQSGTSASIPNGVINGPSSLGSGATGSSSASGNAAYSKTPEPTDNKVDTTSSGESYKSAESSGSTAPEQKGTDETGGSGNNVENAGGSGSTVESSQGAGASTGTAEGGQSGGAGSVGGPVEVNAAHGSESSEAGEGSHGASGEAGGIPSGGSITEIGSSGESSASSGKRWWKFWFGHWRKQFLWQFWKRVIRHWRWQWTPGYWFLCGKWWIGQRYVWLIRWQLCGRKCFLWQQWWKFCWLGRCWCRFVELWYLWRFPDNWKLSWLSGYVFDRKNYC